VRRRPTAGALAGVAGLFAGAAGGFLLGPPAGLLLLAFAGAVGGLLAGGRAEPPLAAGVVGLLERAAALLTGSADDGGHRFVTSTANNRLPAEVPGALDVAAVGGSLDAEGAQQLVGATFADAGGGGDLAGGQPLAGGALAGDQLADASAAVAVGCGAVVAVRVAL
jgi:hypothetical protein